MTSRSRNKYKKLIKRLKKNKPLLVIMSLAAGFILGLNTNKLQPSSNLIISQIATSFDAISADQLKKALPEKGFILINVHTPYEGEIEGTDLFIEHDLILSNKEKLPEDKSAPIVLYCKSGRMSAQALQTLKSMGYTSVSHLKGGLKAWKKAGHELLDLSKLPEEVLPEDGFELPVTWGDVGPILLDIGVIDLPKFEKVMNLTDEQKQILTKGADEPIKINAESSRFVVNMLWALGLAQKSKVYEEGPMGKEYKQSLSLRDKEGVANFASTGGWTLGKQTATNYLGNYYILDLTNEQQEKVSEITKNIYRPCCGNPTWFPDCNHGMAALGAIEIMVAAGISEDEIYANALALNSFWFPQNYLAVATHFARQGTPWSDIDAKLVLGQEFSSAQGARAIAEKVGPLPYGGQVGGSCGA